MSGKDDMEKKYNEYHYAGNETAETTLVPV